MRAAALLTDSDSAGAFLISGFPAHLSKIKTSKRYLDLARLGRKQLLVSLRNPHNAIVVIAGTYWLGLTRRLLLYLGFRPGDRLGHQLTRLLSVKGIVDRLSVSKLHRPGSEHANLMQR